MFLILQQAVRSRMTTFFVRAIQYIVHQVARDFVALCLAFESRRQVLGDGRGVIVSGAAHRLLGNLLVALVETGHVLLCLKMAVEVEQALPEVSDDLNLLQKNTVEALRIDLHVAAWLVYLVQQSHLFLDDADYFVDVAAVRMDQHFFFLQDLFDQLLVIRTEVVHIAAVLLLKLSFRLHPRVQGLHFHGLHRLFTSSLSGCLLRREGLESRTSANLMIRLHLGRCLRPLELARRSTGTPVAEEALLLHAGLATVLIRLVVLVKASTRPVLLHVEQLPCAATGAQSLPAAIGQAVSILR